MKKKVFTVITAVALLLCGCNVNLFSGHGNSSDSFNNSSTSKSSGGNTSSGNSSSSSASSSSSSSSSSSGGGSGDEIVDIQIYGTNDLHGHIQAEESCPSFGTLMTFLKDKKSESNTLLFDQGDAWQGSIYSNLNRGKLITDVMNYIHYDARSVGNHDFDWGINPLKENTARNYNGYSTPVLAGNIYDYDFEHKTVGTTQQSDIGVKSVTLNVDGIKIGVLGGIGRDQITSINSLYTRTIAFTDHIAFIKEEANHLKYDEGCDLIIGSIHTGEGSLKYNGLSSYANLFLCGHTHAEGYSSENNTYYVQASGNQESISHITLKYNKTKKTLINTSVSFLGKNDIESQVSEIDPTIQDILDEYNVDTQANQVVANYITGTFYKQNASNLMAKAIMDRVISEHHNDVVLTLINSAREALPDGAESFTFANIFKSFPFDNDVYIAEVTGRELQQEMSANYICRNANYTNDVINLNGTYKIAVLDYVYFHTDSNRDYDYFSETGGTSNTKLTDNYRNILVDWLAGNGYNNGKELNYSQFTTKYNWNHNKDAFTFE